MSLFGVFLKAAALGAAANALLPARVAQCIPLLDAPQPTAGGDGTKDLVASMALLDRTPKWSIEADDFQSDVQAGTAQLRILRLSDEFTDADCRRAPVMRLVGLFPGVSTDTLYQHLTDLQMRPAWDTNYTFYERFDGTFSGTLQEPSLQRPMAAVSKKRPQCEGDVCTLVPDVSSTALDHHWYGHGVGSPALRRFGIADRLFQYERFSRSFQISGEVSTALSAGVTVYDVLFSGSKRAREVASAASPTLAAWLQARRDSPTCEGVEVNFQHIVIIPLADANEQLMTHPEQLQRLCTMGSVMDETAAKLVYTVLKDSQMRYEEGNAALPASLLVMTSANNVNMPTLLPLWMQKKISGSVSRKAYSQLMAACLKNQEL
jgi:hypothetical protein